MLLNAFMPPILEAFENFLFWAEQAWDSKMFAFWRQNKYDRMYATKSKQIYSFIDIYLGPEYLFHFKCAMLLNITYVTVFYGLGLPLLFPIALLSYFMFWAVERY